MTTLIIVQAPSSSQREHLQAGEGMAGGGHAPAHPSLSIPTLDSKQRKNLWAHPAWQSPHTPVLRRAGPWEVMSVSEWITNGKHAGHCLESWYMTTDPIVFLCLWKPKVWALSSGRVPGPWVSAQKYVNTSWNVFSFESDHLFFQEVFFRCSC